MKRAMLLFACGVFMFQITRAQKELKKEKEIKELMWKSPTKDFQATQVPDNWKSESAVILAIRREHICEDGKNGFQESLNIHYRIKLLDKAAVKEFSELSFNSNDIKTNLWGRILKYRIIGIKVVKTNGQENEVNLNEAVKEDANSRKELKIPIPNLEEGDIIDYYASFKDDNSDAITGVDLLEQKYPVVKQTVCFYLYDKLEFVFKSLGGAPGFSRTIGKGCTEYTLVDNLREKSPDLVWNYEYRTGPNFRYRVRKREDPTDVEVYSMRAVSGFSSNSSPVDLALLVDYMKGNFGNEKDPQKITYELYYLLRNPIYLKAFLHVSEEDPLKVAEFPTQFFVLMDKALSYYHIGHYIMLAPSRSMGSYDNLVNLSSCDYIIRVNTTPLIYITRPTPLSTPSEVAYLLEGTNAAVSYTVDNYDKVIASSMENNQTIKEIKVSLQDNDKSKLNIQRHVWAKGNAKTYYQNLVVTDYDYLKAYDLPKYQVERSHLIGEALKDYNKEKQKLYQRAATDYNERDKGMEEKIVSTMETTVSNFKLEIENIGMWHTDSGTTYKESFVAESLTKKAGSNYIVELGKLIEKQVSLDDAQLKRTRDVYIPFPFSVKYDINFVIPDGFAVEGVENLNQRVENETGGFVSTAKIEGRNVIIHVKKYCSANYFPAKDWGRITTVIQSANNFYNTKLLLKKTS
jgi:hypothetical protein